AQLRTGKDSDYFVKEHICFDISNAVLPRRERVRIRRRSTGTSLKLAAEGADDIFTGVDQFFNPWRLPRHLVKKAKRWRVSAPRVSNSTIIGWKHGPGSTFTASGGVNSCANFA